MYFIKDISGRHFVGDHLVWTNEFAQSTFYFFPEHALEHVNRVLPKMPKTDYTVYKISFTKNELFGGTHMIFSPFKQ